MHSEPAYESRAALGEKPARGRRRKRGSGSAEGPVFVDTSGRRARLLRRVGLLVGAVCVGYAAVLGLAFMGIGTSVSPSSLLPFGGGQDGGGPGPGGGGAGPQGGVMPTGAPPSGAPTAPSGAPTAPSAAPSSSATSSAVATPGAVATPSAAETSSAATTD
ncbi:hypothetical protein ACFWMV_29700 [Streptomyces mutabilis]|uniref:hypothetical protein n=1 Tax=Streptomyces mutabilis TaxID=67332 RepID=UPI003651E2C9